MVEICKRNPETMHSRSWFASWQTCGRKTSVPICHFSMLHPMLTKKHLSSSLWWLPTCFGVELLYGSVKATISHTLKTAIFSYPQLKTSKSNHFLRIIWSSENHLVKYFVSCRTMLVSHMQVRF